MLLLEEEQPSGQRPIKDRNKTGRPLVFQAPRRPSQLLRSYFREVANLHGRPFLHDPCADCRVLDVRAQNELLYLLSSPERYESQRDAGLDQPRDGRAAMCCTAR